jgi:hypothetical protein
VGRKRGNHEGSPSVFVTKADVCVCVCVCVFVWQVMLEARPGVTFKAEEKIFVGEKAW